MFYHQGWVGTAVPKCWTLGFDVCRPKPGKMTWGIFPRWVPPYNPDWTQPWPSKPLLNRTEPSRPGASVFGLPMGAPMPGRGVRNQAGHPCWQMSACRPFLSYLSARTQLCLSLPCGYASIRFTHIGVNYCQQFGIDDSKSKLDTSSRTGLIDRVHSTARC